VHSRPRSDRYSKQVNGHFSEFTSACHGRRIRLGLKFHF
jgi:hypothetical protein